MSDLSGRVAIVTGSGQGLGKQIALELAKRGARVVTNARTSSHAHDTLAEIRARGGDGLAIPADVGQAEQVESLVKATLETFGQVDILVNNAGTTRDNLIVHMKEEDWDFIQHVSLKSAWLCSRAVIRSMIRRKYGRIINISSASGLMGQMGQTNYSASKAGMIGMIKALAQEVASRGVTVNAVAPGFIHTALTEKMPQKMLQRLTEYIPMGRTGTLDDVAYAVAFLASDESDYITGQVLSVDGGLAIS